MDKTQSKPMEMEAGWELDRLIAEKVMGWQLADREAMGWGDGPPMWLTGDEANPTRQNFAPSGFMRDAWEVAEKLGLAVFPRMSEPGWVAAPFDESAMSPYEAIEYAAGRPSRLHVRLRADLSGRAETAPLAIALAAFAAVQAGEEG